MCVAELNVSLLPCQHRWYHLLRPCGAATNLNNCSSKLKLEGWETKCDFCPYCSAWNLSNSEYRLVGNDRTPSIGGLSRTPSVSFTSLTGARRDSRRASLARTDSSGSLANIGAGINIVEKASERNRAINARLDAYLGSNPERVKTASDSSDEEEAQPPSPAEATGEDAMARVDAQVVGKKNTGFVKKSWRKSKRLSLSLFK
ncbi:hypothetical protein K490DRAFT_43540 [Saccharata proteae CBS 121410]|uniref:Uncharacterized protein n=1 Tax=Saccharata proteae CBS 121410 TaxID=1314787 RepID=A0A9P4HWA6_9PEZI|nr:hypothetical protein K490DRAFT_43540 [Saccharata proteae CBS 121410]